MYLHELPRDDEVGTKIYCDSSDGSTYIMFHHVDGMYSYCKTEKGAIVHLAATTPIEPFSDGYKISGESQDQEDSDEEESEEDDDSIFPGGFGGILGGDEPGGFGGFGGGVSGGGGSSNSW